MRAACYARYSSDLRRETSLDDQVAGARAYADKSGWTFLDDHIYSDAGISGASLHGRPGIQALLKAASRTPPPFDVVLVDDTSRLARDTADAIRVVQQLTFCGVRLVFISQGLDTVSEQAETLVAVHGVVDQLYIRELSHKTKRGLQGQLSRGFSTGSRTYGYRSVAVSHGSDAQAGEVIGHRLEIDPVQADVIRLIFQWYVDGVSQPEIVDRLNRMDVPTPRGTRWTKRHTCVILSNERYLGQQIWGQTTFERRPGTNQRVRRKQPRETWHVLDRPDLRIVDEALWRRVTERRAMLMKTYNVTPEGLARGRTGAYSKFFLVGLSTCGTCGKGFTIVSSGHKSRRYGCQNSWRNGKDACDNRLTIMAKVADPVVLEGLEDALLQPAMLDEITAAVTAEVSKALNTQPAERKALEKRRETVAKKLTNLVSAIENGIAMPAVSEQMGKREAELRGIDEELAGLEQPTNVDITVIPTWVRQQLQDLSGLLAENPERAKAELQRLDMRFVVAPVRNEGKPFLRVEATGDLDALCGVRHLPSTARTKALPYPLSTRGQLRPR